MTHAFFLPCNCSENAETKRFFISKDEYSYDSLKTFAIKVLRINMRMKYISIIQTTF